MSDPFLNWLNQEIPMTKAMQISCCDYNQHQLTLTAPLAVNKNDKGTGFAGSTTALATLAGWCLITRYTQDLQLDSEVMIVDSQLRYLRPVTQDFSACVQLPSEEACLVFKQQLQQQGKARIQLQVNIHEDDQLVLTLNGSYFARLKSTVRHS